MHEITAMLTHHPFWGVMTIAVLAWYSTITVYVAIRGSLNIKDMLQRLKDGQEKHDPCEPGN
ncbi:MAG: hypothetical protein NTY19_31855 [Planctomycetota bacterium]|nr:hypothetical protein [Planctomycetota bacterium]